jgi:hypothetical protein
VDFLFEDIARTLGTSAEYERGAARGTWSPVVILIGREPEPLDLGPASSTTPVLVIEIPVASLPFDPARGDRIRWSGTTWRVDEQPQRDRLGLAWRLHCYREAA